MPPVRQTHTYAELELSAAAYDEIETKLRAADYGHAILHTEIVNGCPTIDMHGLGVTRQAEPVKPADGTYAERHELEGKAV